MRPSTIRCAQYAQGLMKGGATLKSAIKSAGISASAFQKWRRGDIEPKKKELKASVGNPDLDRLIDRFRSESRALGFTYTQAINYAYRQHKRNLEPRVKKANQEKKPNPSLVSSPRTWLSGL